MVSAHRNTNLEVAVGLILWTQGNLYRYIFRRFGSLLAFQPLLQVPGVHSFHLLQTMFFQRRVSTASGRYDGLPSQKKASQELVQLERLGNERVFGATRLHLLGVVGVI